MKVIDLRVRCFRFKVWFFYLILNLVRSVYSLLLDVVIYFVVFLLVVIKLINVKLLG